MTWSSPPDCQGLPRPMNAQGLRFDGGDLQIDGGENLPPNLSFPNGYRRGRGPFA